MIEENRNDLQNILTQTLNELKDELGEKFNINNINLAELQRRTGISRGKLRGLKANGFMVKPHGLCGKTSNNNVIDSFSGVLDDLLSRGVSNASACYDRICEVGYTGNKSAVKNYVKNPKLGCKCTEIAIDGSSLKKRQIQRAKYIAPQAAIANK